MLICMSCVRVLKLVLKTHFSGQMQPAQMIMKVKVAIMEIMMATEEKILGKKQERAFRKSGKEVVKTCCCGRR